MPTSTVTLTRFLHYREKFRQAVKHSPISCVIVLRSLVDTGLDISDFMGDNDRLPVEYEIQCLFSKDTAPSLREKFGLESPKDAVVYLSPITVKKVMGTWKLNKKMLSVRLLDTTYLVKRLSYKGEMYDSCIALELELEITTKGG